MRVFARTVQHIHAVFVPICVCICANDARIPYPVVKCFQKFKSKVYIYGSFAMLTLTANYINHKFIIYEWRALKNVRSLRAYLFHDFAWAAGAHSMALRLRVGCDGWVWIDDEVRIGQEMRSQRFPSLKSTELWSEDFSRSSFSCSLGIGQCTRILGTSTDVIFGKCPLRSRQFVYTVVQFRWRFDCFQRRILLPH